MANNTMILAQVIVGSASGAVVQLAGGGERGVTALYSGSGGLALVLLPLLCIANARV
jgi:hypothetical protein